MAIIDPKGLFLGERLAACSDLAQLHWPRLYAAANNYARLELNYRAIIAEAYKSIRKPLIEKDFWAIIREYNEHFLLFVYQAPDGATWGQWQTNERYLLGHKNAADKRSPSPSVEAQERFRQDYIRKKMSNQPLADLFEDVPTCGHLVENTVAGVGVGVGVGEEQKPPVEASGLRPERVPSPQGQKPEIAIVRRVFAYFCERLHRDPARYTLSDERQKRALLRVRERLPPLNGDLAAVEAEMREVVDNLATDEYCVTNGYTGWTEQIFKSRDEYEKRLNKRSKSVAPNPERYRRAS